MANSMMTAEQIDQLARELRNRTEEQKNEMMRNLIQQMPVTSGPSPKIEVKPANMDPMAGVFQGDLAAAVKKVEEPVIQSYEEMVELRDRLDVAIREKEHIKKTYQQEQACEVTRAAAIHSLQEVALLPSQKGRKLLEILDDFKDYNYSTAKFDRIPNDKTLLERLEETKKLGMTPKQAAMDAEAAVAQGG